MTALAPRDVEPGDRVYDRDSDDAATAVVVRERGEADQVPVPPGDEQTVADVNPGYPETAAVVDVAFTDSLDREMPGWRDLDPAVVAGRVAGSAITTYSYPVPRLQRVDDGGTWA